MADDFVIVKSHPSLISFVDSLQKKNAESLSFYPTCTFEREAEQGRIFCGLLNGEPCGYLYAGSPVVDMKIHQVCIEYDARRRLYGASLVVAVEDWAMDSRCSSVTLRCGFDLDANDFWNTMGYTCIGVVDGGIRRMRKINIWRKQLQPALFELVAVEPSRGKTDASVWRKHKQTGIVSQFNRGRSLTDYRSLVVESSE